MISQFRNIPHICHNYQKPRLFQKSTSITKHDWFQSMKLNHSCYNIKTNIKTSKKTTAKIIHCSNPLKNILQKLLLRKCDLYEFYSQL